MELIREIRQIYDNYGFDTQILAASIRTIGHVKDAALAGADCATIPAKIFAVMYKHILTDAGVEAFLKDWKSTGQSIL
jgi:transaldolase